MSEQKPTDAVFLGFRDLHRLYAAGRSEEAFRIWLWRAARRGEFPAPLVLGHLRAWRADEVAAWAAKLQRATYAPAAVALEA